MLFIHMFPEECIYGDAVQRRLSILRRLPMRADAQNLRINRPIHPGGLHSTRVTRSERENGANGQHMAESHTFRFCRGNAAAFLEFRGYGTRSDTHLGALH